jgi:predicted RNase H-like HicB family nuclease
MCDVQIATDQTLIRRVALSVARMASSTRDGANHTDEIRLWREDDWWIAKHVETGVTTQGQSRTVALENLDEAVALHNDEIGREPTDEELQELGIDPTNNRTGDRDPPDVLD